MSKRKKNISSDSIPSTILFTAKILQYISTSLTVNFAKKLFTTPIRYKLPKREHEMNSNSKQEFVYIPNISKQIMVYHYGASNKKVLLVHGWSGRGTQLVKIADRAQKIAPNLIGRKASEFLDLTFLMEPSDACITIFYFYL